MNICILRCRLLKRGFFKRLLTFEMPPSRHFRFTVRGRDLFGCSSDFFKKVSIKPEDVKAFMAGFRACFRIAITRGLLYVQDDPGKDLP
jgi:hypothetical protein